MSKDPPDDAFSAALHGLMQRLDGGLLDGKITHVTEYPLLGPARERITVELLVLPTEPVT